MVFFLDADERIYARYGGRDSKDADNRQSLEGLRHVMASVLRTHAEEPGRIIPKPAGKAVFSSELGGGGRGCMHCHQVQEAINRNLANRLEWDPETPWRYPLPENVGIRLQVDRGNLVEKVIPGSAAARAGIEPGDLLRQAGANPVHSFADMQQALEEAPREGSLRVVYRRVGKDSEVTLELPPRWKKTDISWRTSLRNLVPTLPLSGKNLTTEDRKAFGLTEKALAFRQRDNIAQSASGAGFKPGDIVLGAEGREVELDAYGFQDWVRREYLVGDTIRVRILRDGKQMVLPLVLGRR